MKSLTGKFSSVRGWALLLALLLGAGMMISACGEEEVPAPTTPAPAPPPTPTPPPTPEPEPTGPATPENLRVSGRTSTSITWSWNAVEGSLGYQGQFSTDATFTDTDPTFIIVAPATSHTVSNLSGNMTGHFRVRSGTGTSLTDLTYSEWSDGVSGSTQAPPPATALEAPSGVTTSATTDSVTVSWDEVDDADSYEVEYRLAGAGGNWNNADCGDDGIVEGTSCVVSDLDEGTGYEFRVRGLPADDDDDHLAGAWAEADQSTTGAREVAVSGGMGDLNVTWKSTATTITFSWEPMAGTTYEWQAIGTDADTRLAALDEANPCKGETFFDSPLGMGANFSHEFTVTRGEIRGLCVRIKDEDLDDDEKALSWGWGVTTPVAPTAEDAATIDTMDEKQVATALEWTAVMVKKGFEWELRLVADSGRNDGDLDGAPGKSVQDACDAGTFVDQGDADLNLSITYTRDGAISPFTGYLLCLKYANTAGSTDWAVPVVTAGGIDEIYTPAAKPPSPRYEPSRSTTATDGSSRTLVWTVANRNSENVPRESGDFAAKIIQYPLRYDHDSSDTTNLRSTPAPTSCVTAKIDAGPSALTGGATSPWDEDTTAATITNDLDGLTVTSAAITIPENSGESLGVRLCVRATKDSADGTLNGPWVLGGATTITKKPAS